jgi:hypothetical protein
MRLSRGIMIAAVLAVCCLVPIGCAKQNEGGRVVASINDYHMTVNDFVYESKNVIGATMPMTRFPIDKIEVLEAIIDKEVLLQEAQSQGLDKRKGFMRTIEDYWEQTLLSDLIRRKAKEVAAGITVYDNEIMDYYDSMKTEKFAAIIVMENKDAADQLLNGDGDIMSLIEEPWIKDSVAYVIPSKWYYIGNGYGDIEKKLFDKDVQVGRELVKIEGRWVLIIVEEVRVRQVAPLKEIRARIEGEVREAKERAAIDAWIADLRADSKIVIHSDVFKTLK